MPNLAAMWSLQHEISVITPVVWVRSHKNFFIFWLNVWLSVTPMFPSACWKRIAILFCQFIWIIPLTEKAGELSSVHELSKCTESLIKLVQKLKSRQKNANVYERIRPGSRRHCRFFLVLTVNSYSHYIRASPSKWFLIHRTKIMIYVTSHKCQPSSILYHNLICTILKIFIFNIYRILSTWKLKLSYGFLPFSSWREASHPTGHQWT